MKAQIAFYFLILGTVQLGLLIGVYHYKKTQQSLLKSEYWTFSLAINILALYLFAFGIFFIDDVSKPPFSFAVANTLFYIGSILQLLFCISLNSDITKLTLRLCAAAIVVFIPVFEYLRIYSDFETRTVFMCCLTALLYIGEIQQLIVYKKTIASKQIEYLKFATSVELMFAICRITVVIFPTLTIHEVEQIPAILTFVTLLQFVMNTLSYIAIGGYWTETISIKNHQFQLENERINQLLREQNKLIYSLSIANKTATTGALAASIAHELNQPLGASNLNIQLLQLNLEKNNFDTSLFKEVLAALQTENSRASTIIKSLRSIFLNEQVEDEKVQLQIIIEEVLTICRPDLEKHNIEFHLKANSAPSINCVPSQIKQVFLNLFNNSIDSLNKSNQPNKNITLSVHQEETNIQIDLFDNGIGISKEKQSELFELLSGPKTTGMGLGLWLSRHIITNHRGTLDFIEVPQGALFRIKIPSK